MNVTTECSTIGTDDARSDIMWWNICKGRMYVNVEHDDSQEER